MESDFGKQRIMTFFCTCASQKLVTEGLGQKIHFNYRRLRVIHVNYCLKFQPNVYEGEDNYAHLKDDVGNT